MSAPGDIQELREAQAEAEETLARAERDTREAHREALDLVEDLAEELREAEDRADELCAGVAQGVNELKEAAEYCDEAGDIKPAGQRPVELRMAINKLEALI